MKNNEELNVMIIQSCAAYYLRLKRYGTQHFSIDNLKRSNPSWCIFSWNYIIFSIPIVKQTSSGNDKQNLQSISLVSSSLVFSNIRSYREKSVHRDDVYHHERLNKKTTIAYLVLKFSGAGPSFKIWYYLNYAKKDIFV